MTTTAKIDRNHKLRQAVWLPSAHCQARPAWATPELVVVHCVSLPEGSYGTGAPARLFQGTLDTAEHPSFADLAGVQVSAHVMIERPGRVLQFVPFDQQAWHAGASLWRGRRGCNAFSIGIELEGCVADGYTMHQYRALRDVLQALLVTYPSLSVSNIVGHADIAPGRKQDPGPQFDWASLLAALHADMRALIDS